MKLIKRIKKSELTLKLVLLNLEKENELQSYFDLFNDCFGKRENINKELFEWFNLRPPNFKNLTFAFIDESTNQLIAAYGLLPRLANVHNKITSYCLCTNVMTHPNYGGKGLFKQIGIEALSYVGNLGYTFCIGIPNKLAIRGHLSIGWEIINKVNFYELIPNASNDLQESENIEIGKLLEKSDDFYHGMMSQRDLYSSRTKDWINWRCSKTNSKFKDFLIEEESGNAYIVIKEFFGDGKKKIHIVDYGYSSLESLKKILSTISNYGKKAGVDLINLWLYKSNIDEVNLFESFNYIQTELINEVIVYKLDENEMVLPKSNWHLTLFDNDVY